MSSRATSGSSAWSNSISGRGCRLRIAVAWRGDELVATLPLVIRPGFLYRGLEWASEFFADYCDVLMAPGGDGRLLQALWNAIDRAGGFDVVRLNQVRPDGRVKQLLDTTRNRMGKAEAAREPRSHASASRTPGPVARRGSERSRRRRETTSHGDAGSSPNLGVMLNSGS